MVRHHQQRHAATAIARGSAFGVLWVGILGMTLAAHAQPNPPAKGSVPKPPAKSTAIAPAAENASDYSGVTPFGGDPPMTQPPPQGYQNITWPGFRLTETGSEVFLQMTGKVDYAQKVKGRTLHIVLEKTLVPLRNNLRPILTQHFPGTPVKQFRLRLKKAGKVELEIQLLRKAIPTVAVNTQGQYFYLIISFSNRPQAEE